MAELPIATQCGTGAPAAPPLDSGPVSGYGASFDRRNHHGLRRQCGNPERSVLSWGQAPGTPLDSNGCHLISPAETNGGAIGGRIPDRSPGHAFIAIAHAGWCRHTKV